MKCRPNLNFEKMDTASTQEKMMGFDEKYLRSASNKIFITAVLRKSNAHSAVICRLIKKSIKYIKIDSRGKIDSNFFAYEILVRRNLM